MASRSDRASRRPAWVPVVGAVASIGIVAVVISVAASARTTDGDVGLTMSRDEFEEELRAEGAPRDVAACVAAKQPERIVDHDSARDVDRIMVAVLECMDIPSDEASCVIDGLGDRFGQDLSRSEFVDAVVDPGGRRSMVEVSMECAGLSADEARCVTDAMVDEFGPGVFRSDELRVGDEQRDRLPELALRCAFAADDEEEGAVATTTHPTTTTATPTTRPSSSPACVALSDALARLVELHPADATEAAAGLAAVAANLGTAARQLDGSLSTDLDDLHRHVQYVGWTFDDMENDRRTADPATAAAMDDVVRTLPSYLDYMAAGIELREWVPGLESACDLEPHGVTEDLAEEFATALEAFIATPVGQDAVYEMFHFIAHDLAREAGVAESALQVEYDQCRGDRTAMQLGDDSGCDALANACDGGDMAACNDLYWASLVGSEYEGIAASCGGRDRTIAPEDGGYCGEPEG